MHDLCDRMNASIGSTGTDRFDRLVRHFREGIFHDSLDADTVSLTLPAVIGCAVVLDTECNAKGFVFGAYA
jgi:hypothetical protein